MKLLNAVLLQIGNYNDEHNLNITLIVSISATKPMQLARCLQRVDRWQNDFNNSISMILLDYSNYRLQRYQSKDFRVVKELYMMCEKRAKVHNYNCALMFGIQNCLEDANFLIDFQTYEIEYKFFKCRWLP